MIHPDFEMQINVTSECGTLHVTDVSTWPYVIVPGNNWDRDQTGISLWWSADGGVTWDADFTNQGDNITPGQWDIPVNNQGTYLVVAFGSPVWHIHISANQGSIWYYDGNFYQAINYIANSVIPPDTDTTNWLVLDENDYTVFANNWSCCDNDFVYCEDENTVVVACEPTSINNVINIGCHTWLVNQPYAGNTTETVIVQVWNLAMTEMIACYTMDVLNGITNVTITAPEDGVYIIRVGYENSLSRKECGIDLTRDYFEWPIYDICDLLACYNSLVRSIMCREYDPCCTDCDPEVQKQRDIWREELNKMIALAFSLFAYLNVEAMTYMGVNLLYTFDFTSPNPVFEPIDPDRNMVIAKINDLIEKLKAITGRCGDCNGAREDTTNTPCANC